MRKYFNEWGAKIMQRGGQFGRPFEIIEKENVDLLLNSLL
jgi:hypothetical protein